TACTDEGVKKMADDGVPIDVRQPPDHHPETLKGDALRPAVTQAYTTLSKILTAQERLDEAAKGERPRPPGKRMSQVERALFQEKVDEWTKRTSGYRADFAKQATPRIERTLATLDGAIASAEKRAASAAESIEKTLVPRPASDPYHIEIRAALKGADFGRIAEAVKADPATAHAVLGAPAYLVGLSPKQREALHDLAVDAYCRDENRE